MWTSSIATVDTVALLVLPLPATKEELEDPGRQLGERCPPALHAVPCTSRDEAGSWPSGSTESVESIQDPPPSGIHPIVERSERCIEDEALVRSAWRGDPGAHAAIWRKYSSLVKSKLGRSVGGQDVEDHVQEVFVRLFEYISQLRDPGALRSFIIGITLRVAGTELRRRRSRWWLRLTPTGDLPEPGVMAQGDSEAREVLSRLLVVLGKLTPQSCRVFELRFIEEKELSEVAQAMNISVATAKRYLARVSARVLAMAEREPALAGYLKTAPLKGRGKMRLSAAE
jgi:RNA polymerase sigma-70 factor (ECF subfamily)